MADYAPNRGGGGAAAAAAAAAQPPNLFARRAAAVVLGLCLFRAASPFTPVSWFTQPDWTTYLDGPRLVDRVLSPVLLLGAAVLHWYVASVHRPLPLTVAVPDPNAAGGNVQQGRDIVLGLWLPSYFWPAAALEAAVLWGMGPGGLVVNEFMRRSVLVSIIVSVWVVGWNAMPWYRKQQAWGFIKDYVVRLILMEMMDMTFGGGRRRQRRRM